MKRGVAIYKTSVTLYSPVPFIKALYLNSIPDLVIAAQIAVKVVRDPQYTPALLVIYDCVLLTVSSFVTMLCPDVVRRAKGRPALREPLRHGPHLLPGSVHHLFLTLNTRDLSFYFNSLFIDRKMSLIYYYA